LGATIYQTITQNKYMEYNEQGEREEIYSRPVRAGKRTYFFDVKSTKGEDLYLTITESKKRFRDDGTFFYEKHKVFLYKEDFEKFTEGLNDALDFISTNNKSEVKKPESFEENSETVVSEKDSWSNIEFEDLGNI
jgi:hypothetical protein